MSGIKDSLLEDTERHEVNIARNLGISWEDLQKLDYRVNINSSKEGMIYGYIIEFSKENDPESLRHIKGIDSNNTVYLSPWTFESTDDNDYELEAISENTDPRASFYNEIRNLERLLKVEVDDKQLKDVLIKQVFISIIISFETYLSDTFINEALRSKNNLQRFVATNPEFKSKKISLSEIFTEHEKIEDHAKNIMAGTIYHKLQTVRNMYQDTFGIEFPDISEMQRFISIRHDLVHRNGKTTKGEIVQVDEDCIKKLTSAASALVDGISDELDPMRFDIPF